MQISRAVADSRRLIHLSTDDGANSVLMLAGERREERVEVENRVLRSLRLVCVCVTLKPFYFIFI